MNSKYASATIVAVRKEGFIMNFVLFLGILLILGLASSRVMKVWKLPNVTGYLIVGLIAAGRQQQRQPQRQRQKARQSFHTGISFVFVYTLSV